MEMATESTNEAIARARSYRSPGPGRSARGVLARLADGLAWPLRVSHYLDLVNPLWATHALRARVEAVQDETQNARTLTLRPGPGWRRHRAGQHVRVGVVLGGRQAVRTYSISSPPERTDGCFTITVRAIPDGRVSPHLARRLLSGAYVSIGLPQGDFVLPDAMPDRLLFITAGSGITPVMSMLRHFAARDDMPEITHLHYAPGPDDVIFSGELEQLTQRHPGYRLHRIYTRQLDGPAPRSGHFTARQLDDLCPDWRECDAYGCGPQALLDSLEAHWQRAGRPERLRIERFRARLAEAPTGDSAGRVRFRQSGVDVDTDGRTSLLRLAESAGLAPAYGCRMGICHSCTTTLVGGCARDLRNNTLIREPGAPVQICVCAAAGDIELAL